MSALLPVYERDLVLVSGKGARLFDAEGKAYLDFAAGIAVNGFGYGDRKVLAAIKQQAARLIHASNLFHTQPAAALADRLAAVAFPSKVFFCNSGTEAVEGALKFARKVGNEKGRFELVAFERGFHGRTLGALSVTWSPRYREPFEPLLPGVRFAPWNDLDALSSLVGEKTAAVIVEPVQGEGGVRPADPAFLDGLTALARERGALVIFDEVQSGLGRTGKMFAYQHADATPDILTLAKPLGGGLPMGAILIREELAGAIKPGDHGSTFGGNPVVAAAALAVLERLTAPGFLETIERRSAAILRGLKSLKRRFPEAVADVRGRGLMIGIEFKGEAGPVLKGLRERSVLATKAGDNVLRLLPPLVVSPRDIREFLGALEAVVAQGAGRRME
jgi:predicted acetylornithine/succinylornithine family transaminase